MGFSGEVVIRKDQYFIQSRRGGPGEQNDRDSGAEDGEPARN